MSKKLVEAIASAPAKKGNRWRVIVAKPGQGSSGYYSEEVLKRDAHKIIAPGGQAFINHESSRNPKDMIGVYPDGSYWDEVEKAVVSELETFSHWAPFVEEVGPHCGMSLYAMGESDEENNVTAILEHVQNGCDLVARPGLVGSGIAEKLYESALAGSEKKPSVTVAQREDEGDNMELEAKVDKALEILAGLVAEKEKAVSAEAQVEADAKAVAEAVTNVLATVKAVEEAELLDVQREAILEAAKTGADVAPLIESAKAVKEAAVKAVEESAKRELEEGSGRVIGITRNVENATELGKVFG